MWRYTWTPSKVRLLAYAYCLPLRRRAVQFGYGNIKDIQGKK